jgi:hypothetical protein
MIAKQSTQPNAASAMALERNTKKPRMLGMKERSANGSQVGDSNFTDLKNEIKWKIK